jgi:hypothetical protein
LMLPSGSELALALNTNGVPSSPLAGFTEYRAVGARPFSICRIAVAIRRAGIVRDSQSNSEGSAHYICVTILLLSDLLSPKSRDTNDCHRYVCIRESEASK